MRYKLVSDDVDVTIEVINDQFKCLSSNDEDWVAGEVGSIEELDMSLWEPVGNYTQSKAKRMHDALEEAVGWNWLDGDVPQDINEKCIGLLAELEKQNT